MFNYYYYLFNIKAKGHEGHLHCSTQYKFKHLIFIHLLLLVVRGTTHPRHLH